VINHYGDEVLNGVRGGVTEQPVEEVQVPLPDGRGSDQSKAVTKRIEIFRYQMSIRPSLTVDDPVPTIAASMRAFILFVASAGYLGYIPVASGTFGSLVGIPLFWAFDALRHASVPAYILVYIAAVAAACWIAGKADEYLHEHDSHKIVIDEVVGYLAATLFVTPTVTHALVAFILFRALDVIKPFPANYIDAQLPGGYGVVLDDVASGLYSNVILRALIGIGVFA
jgi:phosphatidylglycerophosphatase A